MRRVLVLFAHPALQKSRVQRELGRAVRALPGVTFHDLYEAYPDFDVEVAREQALLSEHDVVVLQFPFYWYSTPALLKQWQDLVLEQGWAYGREGKALHGKLLLCALSTGGSEASYQPGGSNRATILQLLAPLAQMAQLCGMQFLPPFVVHETYRLGDAALAAHGAGYAALLAALRDERIVLAAARGQARINADLSALIG